MAKLKVMDYRNAFKVEELNFLRQVEKEIECFNLQEIEEGIKDRMQEDIEEETEEEIEKETEEEIEEETEDKISFQRFSKKMPKKMNAEEVEEETEQEDVDETEEKIKEVMEEETEEEIVDETEDKISFQRVSKKMPKKVNAEEVEEETEEEDVDETEEKIKEVMEEETEESIVAETEEKIKEVMEEETEEEDVDETDQKIQEVIEEKLDSSNFEEFEESSSYDGLHKDLQKDKAAKAALEEKLRITRAETKRKEAQRRKRKENSALSKFSKKEQVEKDQTAHFRQSEKDQEHRYAKPQKQKSKMTADLKEKAGLVEKFKDESKGNCEVIFQGPKTIKELKQAYEDLSMMKRKFLEQDNEIKSLHISIVTLQNRSEAKSNTISMLQERVDQGASGLKEEQAKHCKLQRDYEAALSQQQRDKEELIDLTCKNQQLALEQKRPQGEPKDDHKRQRARYNQLTAKFKQEQGKNNKLQKDLEVALSKQHKDKEELLLLTSKNQKLALELKRLRGELEDGPKRELAQDSHWALKLKQEQAKYNKLQKDLEVALSQQQKDKEKLMFMTFTNQKLPILAQKRLRAELEKATKRELAQDSHWALKLKQEQGKYNELQKDYEAVLSQQQKDKEELMLLTCKNQQLALDKNGLQGELEDVKLKRELSLIQLKKDRDTCNMLEEKLRKYKTRLLREINQNEKQNKASKATESKMNNMHTPRMENEDIMVQIEADLGRKHKEINSNFHELRIPPPTSRTTKSCSALQKGSPAHHSVSLSRTQKVHHSV